MAKKKARGKGPSCGETSGGVRIEKEQFDELLQDQDRARAIVLHCNLEGVLAELLRAAMVSGNVANELMNTSFHRKAQLAYAFRLIPEAAHADLNYLNRVRNKFAHCADIRSFHHEKIRTLCQRLSVKETRAGLSLEPYDAFRATGSKLHCFLRNEIEVKQKVQAGCRQKQLEDDFRRQDLQETYDGWNARYGYKERAGASACQVQRGDSES